MKTARHKSAGTSQQRTARLSAKVSAEAYQRLCVHALMTGQTMGDVLDRLVLSGCRDYSLPGKIVARVATHDRAVPDASGTLSDAPLPLQDAA